MPSNWADAIRKQPCPFRCGEQDQTEYVGGGVWLCTNCSKTFIPEKQK